MSEKEYEYLEYFFDRKTIYVVKHHTVALKCWIKALNNLQINPKTVLVHIDKHSDLGFNLANLEKSKRLLDLSETELDSFIQLDLNKDNSEFISTP